MLKCSCALTLFIYCSFASIGHTDIIIIVIVVVVGVVVSQSMYKPEALQTVGGGVTGNGIQVVATSRNVTRIN
jgi:hypothetical protein